jgi:hypothetical protein
VATVLERPVRGDADWIALFAAVDRAIREATATPDCPTPDSRTTLAVARAAGGTLEWASMGDSSIFVTDGRRAEELGDRRSRYLGYGMSAGEVDRALTRGTRPLAEDEWVVVITDGFTGFVRGRRRAARAVATAAATADSPEALARSLIGAAFAAGAGDAVAVALTSPQRAIT